MEGKRNLGLLGAGNVLPDVTMSLGRHVLGMTGTASWTVVHGDGTVKRRTSQAGGDEVAGKVAGSEVQALALAIIMKASDLKADPPSGDLHGYMNRRVTIDVPGEPPLHLDFPASQAEKPGKLKEVADAFDRLEKLARGG